LRIRSIKPEWLDDERMCDCSTPARLLSIVLIVMADDYGNARLGPERVIAARSFPSEPDPVASFRDAFSELEGWYVERYTERDQWYYHIRNWDKHQRMDNAGKPLCPAPSTVPTQEETRARDRVPGPDPDPDPDPGPAASRGESRRVAANYSGSTASVRDMPPALMQDHRPMGAERDILLEVCEEYGRVWRVVPPDLPTGDHQRRFLGALRDPSGGRDVLLAAVRGHHRRASHDGAKVGRELRHVVPPATEHGSLAPHRPDMTRVLEYASADPRRGKARAAAPARPPDPAPAPITPEEAEAADQRMAEFRRMMAERRASASHPPDEDRAARIAREKSERVAAEAELREHAARRAGG
jgi:hypothetical protein